MSSPTTQVCVSAPLLQEPCSLFLISALIPTDDVIKFLEECYSQNTVRGTRDKPDPTATLEDGSIVQFQTANVYFLHITL